MNDSPARALSTPRLVVVGLFVFTASCHRQKPTVTTLPRTAPTPPAAPAPTVVSSGSTLIRALAERYTSTWYRSLTFTQKTTLALPSGGKIVQTYYESGVIPGKLRIDTDLPSKTGLL